MVPLALRYCLHEWCMNRAVLAFQVSLFVVVFCVKHVAVLGLSIIVASQVIVTFIQAI